MKGSRQQPEEYRVDCPEEMYSHPYMNHLRLTVTLRASPLAPSPPAPPWGFSPCRYTLRLVEADTLVHDRLQSALGGEGVTGQLYPDQNAPTATFYSEERFWVEKGFISYHFQNKQFRIVALLHNDTSIWATYVSAPFMILAKRKERIHDYNTVAAKWTRTARLAARRRKQATDLAGTIGLGVEEAQQADDLLKQLAGLNLLQQQYILRLWTGLDA
jgi:hypothetical protein